MNNGLGWVVAGVDRLELTMCVSYKHLSISTRLLYFELEDEESRLTQHNTTQHRKQKQVFFGWFVLEVGLFMSCFHVSSCVLFVCCVNHRASIINHPSSIINSSIHRFIDSSIINQNTTASPRCPRSHKVHVHFPSKYQVSR